MYTQRSVINTGTGDGKQKLFARTGNQATALVPYSQGNTLASGGWTSGLNQIDGVAAWKRSYGAETGAIGRYKQDIAVMERDEDWMKPDLILRAADFPA